MLTKSRIFLCFCLAFILGVLLGGVLGKSAILVLAMVFVPVFCLFVRHKTAAVIAAAGLLLVAGSLRFLQFDRPMELEKYFGEQTVLGTIVEDPDVRDTGTYLTVGNLVIDKRAVEGRARIEVQNFPGHEYGECLILTGKLLPIEDYEPGFSYKAYLKKSGVVASMKKPKAEILRPDCGSGWKAALIRIKKKFDAAINASMPEPEAAFSQGLLLGERKSLPPELTDNLNRTSTSHVVAISGFNITIIVNALGRLLNRFGRKFSFIATIICLIAFTILTGASASVVRASFMGSLSLVALNVGRLYAVTNALALSAALMLYFNPLLLKFDLGFQLSFLALIGLVVLSPILEEKFKRAPKFIKEYLFPTLSAQALTLPVILVNFGRLSLVAPLTNVLVLPLIPPAMLLSFIAASAGLALGSLSLPLFWLAWSVLFAIIRIIEITATLPFSSLELDVPPFFVWLWFAPLAAVIIKLRKKRNLWPET